MSRPVHAGFTLIELLVVIAILSILVGLLLPVITGAKAAAQFLRCQTNLRTIGQAVNAYAVDHAGIKVPYAWPEPSSPVGFGAGSSGPITRFRPPSLGQTVPIGIGILVAEDYLVFENLLDPGRNMQDDTSIDLDKWTTPDIFMAGSSYLYFYRTPPALGQPTPPDLIDRLTLERFENLAQRAVLTDANAEAGHQFVGAFRPGEPWISHPQEGRSNVLFLDGSVASGGHDDWVLEAPAGNNERGAWFAKAHTFYGGE